jgi:hypothetical protein
VTTRQEMLTPSPRMIADIQKEWERRRTVGDAFNDFDRPELGMLALGYRVGHTEGKPPRIRRLTLTFVLEGELPMVHSAIYTEEWGEPGSLKRYRKLVRKQSIKAKYETGCGGLDRRSRMGLRTMPVRRIDTAFTAPWYAAVFPKSSPFQKTRCCCCA